MLLAKKISAHKLLVLWFTVFVVVLAILIGGAMLKERMRAEEHASLEQEARMLNDALIEYTNQIVSEVNALLNGVRYFYVHSGSLSATESFINALNFDKAVIHNIYLINAEGTVVVSHNNEAHGLNVEDREYFQKLRTSTDGKPFISAVEKGRVTNRLNFRISLRINKPDGSFGGVVLATIQPEAFSRHYRQLSAGHERAATLVGSLDRKIRARIPDLAPDQWQAPLESVLWEFFAKLPSGTYQTRSFVDGIARTYVYKQVGDLPLIMLHGFSQQEVENNVDTRFMRIAIWGIPVLLFILMLALTVSQALMSRERLEQAYRQLAKLNQQIRKQAMLDTLTGLPNRPMFFSRLSRELSQSRRNDRLVALLFMDLDGFKQVNDQFGHDAGDIVLKTVAARWQAIVRENDMVARLGGDEFAAIISDLEDAAHAALVAEKLIAALQQDITLPGELPCQVGCSVGISLYPKSAAEIDSLLAAADAAMYQSKARGKNSLTLSSASPAPGDAEWVKFTSNHLVGVAEIDEQHRQLVKRVNKINRAIINKLPIVETEALFMQLVEFTVFHFDTEHRLMVQYQYPGQAVHDHEHQSLIDEIERLADEFSRGNDLLVLQTIKDWLIGHIEGADKPLGAFIARAEARNWNGRSVKQFVPILP